MFYMLQIRERERKRKMACGLEIMLPFSLDVYNSTHYSAFLLHITKESCVWKVDVLVEKRARASENK